MGYCTDFELMVDGNVDIVEIKQKLDHLSTYDFYLKERCVLSLDEAKWYDHVKNMRELSSFYPDVVFTLFGVGEEQGDIWREYYKGGRLQRENAKITFDPYDESKLR